SPGGPRRGPARAGRGADRMRRLSERDHLGAASLAGAAVQHHALDRDAARRAFRGDGAAGAARRRHPRILSRASMTTPIGRRQMLLSIPSLALLPRALARAAGAPLNVRALTHLTLPA